MARDDASTRRARRLDEQRGAFDTREGADHADAADDRVRSSSRPDAYHASASKQKRGSLSYTARMTMAFAAVAFMTALVTIGILSFVWEQQFQTYTRDNIERIATTIATNVGARYARTQDWHGGALTEAANVSGYTKGIGVRITDADGVVLYDDSRVGAGDISMSLAPNTAEATATAPILVEGEAVGTVHVWVYGSTKLLTEADAEFRNRSYEAVVFSTLIAVAIALMLGVLFARGLVNPINRISKAAHDFGMGDLTARTNMSGDDEIARLGMTFDKMAESVEKDRELEHRLTTDVAHELRTPLMAIQSTVEAIIDGVFEPDEERLDTINSEVQRLSRLVDAILKLARLENRSIPMEKRVVNVGDLMTTLIATHEAYVYDSGLELRFSADPDVYVHGDPDMLRQATANLISNAVRKTSENGDSRAIISVADTGIGLSEEDAKMVFSRFWRADAGRNRASGGLGVGLAVVKEIVDQHNGWVEVEGEPGVGATFSINIPLFSESQVRQDTGRIRRSRSDSLNDEDRLDHWIDAAFDDGDDYLSGSESRLRR